MREYRLIEKAIKSFSLDLTGKRIFTEAASGPFVWTPLIAALAGAEKVYAVTRDSQYGSAESIKAVTMDHARTLGVADRILVQFEKDPTALGGADIVTNLGFVRPLDESTVNAMRVGAVIPLMWEPWEFRKEDVDLEASINRGIAIVGTNERDERLLTFRAVAMTVLKLLLENNIEVIGSDILILGQGVFAEETATLLRSLGASIFTESHLGECTPDCVICLEHHDHEKILVGSGGLYDPAERGRAYAMLLHICGRVDVNSIHDSGMLMVPKSPADLGYMSFTTGYLGPKPVIDLHTAGLKVGQAWLDDDRVSLKTLALSLPNMPEHLTVEGRY